MGPGQRRFLPLLAILFTLAPLLPNCKSATSSSDGSGERWTPGTGATWQWQLTGTVDTSYDADMYDIDLFDGAAGAAGALHGAGRTVICYFSAGSWEDWRPDRGDFPAAVIGRDYEGWTGEKWLDIRQIELLAPVMQARLDLAASLGCDGVEPDNVDGYTNSTGFPLTYDDQIAYNTWLASEAHARGLSVGLKNDPDQAAALEPFFDWAMTEDCFDEGWCADMLPFVNAGKSVFAAEYKDTGMTIEKLCPAARDLRFSAILKNRDLDAYRESCD